MAIQKVHQGDRLKIRATDWNEIASHVNGAVRVPSAGKGKAQQLVSVYNASGMDLTRGSFVKLTGTRYMEGAFFDAYVFTAEFPKSGEDDFIPAVTVEEIKKNDCGRAIISGLAPVRIASGNGLFGTPDGHGCLKLSDSGPIMVIPYDNDATLK